MHNCDFYIKYFIRKLYSYFFLTNLGHSDDIHMNCMCLKTVIIFHLLKKKKYYKKNIEKKRHNIESLYRDK